MATEAPARESVIAFRCTNAESREIDKAAQAAKTDRGAYLRMKVLGHESGICAAATDKTPRKRGHATMQSVRLATLYALLKDKGADGATGLDLARWTNGLAIATSISEIRRQLPAGQAITCTLEGKSETGAKIYRYRLVTS